MIPWSDTRPERAGAAWITITLIAAIVIVHLIAGGGTAKERSERYARWSAVPCEITSWEPLTIAERNRLVVFGDDDACGALPTSADEAATTSDPSAPWEPGKNIAVSIVASIFLHGGWLHLVSNGWALWIFGDNVEKRLRSPAFVALFGLAGLVGVFAHVLSTPDSLVPMVGASGAIAGVMGAYLILYPDNELKLIGLGSRTMPAWRFIVLWTLLQLALILMDTSIAWGGHLGGLGTGVLFGVGARLGSRHLDRASGDMH